MSKSLNSKLVVFKIISVYLVNSDNQAFYNFSLKILITD